MTPNHEFTQTIIDVINRGQKIEAIKLLREATGIGLKEAKDQVERYIEKGEIGFPEAKQSTSDGDLLLDQSVIDVLNRGRKIEAIKLLRASRRIGLKEAKELVDRYCGENGVNVESGGESSLLNYVIVALVIGLAIYFVYKFLKG